ncbi:MAG: hypothetical protein ACTSUO_00085 [Candidatus Thorarchaeota archaeon]
MKSATNPENLIKCQILDLIKYCLVYSTPLPERKLECANKECGVRQRVEITNRKRRLSMK